MVAGGVWGDMDTDGRMVEESGTVDGMEDELDGMEDEWAGDVEKRSVEEWMVDVVGTVVLGAVVLETGLAESGAGHRAGTAATWASWQMALSEIVTAASLRCSTIPCGSASAGCRSA